MSKSESYGLTTTNSWINYEIDSDRSSGRKSGPIKDNLACNLTCVHLSVLFFLGVNLSLLF